jgi:hypothetical protein
MDNQVKKRIPVVLLTEAEKKLVSKFSSEPEKPEAKYIKKSDTPVRTLNPFSQYVFVSNPCVILKQPFLVAQQSTIIPITLQISR